MKTKNQNDENALNLVLDIVKKYIKSPQAKRCAKEIIATNELIYPWLVCPHCKKELAADLDNS